MGATTVTALVLSAALLASCSSSDTSPARSSKPTTATTGQRSSSPLRTAAGDTAVVASIGVQPADVPNGYMVVAISGGAQVQGSVTLDLCAARFPSEAFRTARHQVAVVDSQRQNWLSTEAVLYENPGATEQAFLELRAAQARCPATFVAPANSDVTPIKTTFNPAPDARWPATPGVDRLAFDMVLTDQQNRSLHTVTVYLRRGRVLLGVYFPQPDRPQLQIAGGSTMATIVSAFADRLSHLPASAVS